MPELFETGEHLSKIVKLGRGNVSYDEPGRRASFGECLATGLRYMLPVLGIGILFGIAVGLGLILAVYRHFKTTDLDEIDSLKG